MTSMPVYKEKDRQIPCGRVALVGAKYTLHHWTPVPHLTPKQVLLAVTLQPRLDPAFSSLIPPRMLSCAAGER